ncbi:MAG: yaiW, partial [Variovorax sp.]|nr:yaiW [Variovorax sp.]
KVGSTEAAVRSIGPRLGLSDGEVRRALEQEGRPSLEQTRLWSRVFELADAQARRPVPRAVLPRIRLHSPKITRSLTTEWFARRVDERYQRCRGKGGLSWTKLPSGGFL